MKVSFELAACVIKNFRSECHTLPLYVRREKGGGIKKWDTASVEPSFSCFFSHSACS